MTVTRAFHQNNNNKKKLYLFHFKCISFVGFFSSPKKKKKKMDTNLRVSSSPLLQLRPFSFSHSLAPSKLILSVCYFLILFFFPFFVTLLSGLLNFNVGINCLVFFLTEIKAVKLGSTSFSDQKLNWV